jgi:hypothetical protein
VLISSVPVEPENVAEVAELEPSSSSLSVVPAPMVRAPMLAILAASSSVPPEAIKAPLPLIACVVVTVPAPLTRPLAVNPPAVSAPPRA